MSTKIMKANADTGLITACRAAAIAPSPWTANITPRKPTTTSFARSPKISAATISHVKPNGLKMGSANFPRILTYDSVVGIPNPAGPKDDANQRTTDPVRR